MNITSLKRKSLISSFLILFAVPMIAFGQQCQKMDNGVSCKPEIATSSDASKAQVQALKHKSGKIALAIRAVASQKLFSKKTKYAYASIGGDKFRFDVKLGKVRKQNNGNVHHLVIVYLFEYATSRLTKGDNFKLQFGKDGPTFEISKVIDDLVFLTTDKT